MVFIRQRIFFRLMRTQRASTRAGKFSGGGVLGFDPRAGFMPLPPRPSARVTPAAGQLRERCASFAAYVLPAAGMRQCCACWCVLYCAAAEHLYCTLLYCAAVLCCICGLVQMASELCTACVMFRGAWHLFYGATRIAQCCDGATTANGGWQQRSAAWACGLTMKLGVAQAQLLFEWRSHIAEALLQCQTSCAGRI
jgi:hypothetical protein